MTTNTNTTTNSTTQSIFVTLDTLTTSTSVPGQTPKMQPHTLPRAAFPTSEQFENEQELITWATDSGIMHAVLQKGVRSHLIDIRAKFKACKKNDIWSNQYGQQAVDSYEWEIQTRPNQNNAASIKLAAQREAALPMATAMYNAGLDDTTVLNAMIPVYGEVMANAILEEVKQ